MRTLHRGGALSAALRAADPLAVLSGDRELAPKAAAPQAGRDVLPDGPAPDRRPQDDGGPVIAVPAWQGGAP